MTGPAVEWTKTSSTPGLPHSIVDSRFTVIRTSRSRYPAASISSVSVVSLSAGLVCQIARSYDAPARGRRQRPAVTSICLPLFRGSVDVVDCVWKRGVVVS